jgi:hypothetical protein
MKLIALVESVITSQINVCTHQTVFVGLLNTLLQKGIHLYKALSDLNILSPSCILSYLYIFEFKISIIYPEKRGGT